MTVSPTHLWSWEWKPNGHENCFDETYPIQEASYWGVGSLEEIQAKKFHFLFVFPACKA
ncbi:hypothetical protein SLEP1_g51887 [Rubroshorea leprosula]|uniref:Uncharacterized protein n=1 Tax=Rubroshorea leprosula TaxID=152421 RepID=A0AAV5M5G2_9ROSI|nr:hypothetical protein SLEP1_g51887 [Rubroshorea leprosula]